MPAYDALGGQPPKPPRQVWWRKRRPGRLKGSMVALSTAAILSVYAVGYVDSSGEEDPALAASVPATSAVSTSTTAPATTSSSGSTSSGATAATATPTPESETPETSALYADGTYVGTGSSRHGSIEATVVVEDGQIVSADITGCGTRWPCSRVSQLPARVLAAQSADVNYVSGATDSSQAYLRAVAAALQQAEAAT